MLISLKLTIRILSCEALKLKVHIQSSEALKLKVCTQSSNALKSSKFLCSLILYAVLIKNQYNFSKTQELKERTLLICSDETTQKYLLFQLS